MTGPDASPGPGTLLGQAKEDQGRKGGLGSRSQRQNRGERRAKVMSNGLGIRRSQSGRDGVG